MVVRRSQIPLLASDSRNGHTCHELTTEDQRRVTIPPCLTRTATQTWGIVLLSVRGELLFRDCIEELDEYGAILGKHAQELYAVAELRIAGDDCGRDNESAAGFKFEIEIGARRKWVHAFDVASAEAQVGGSAAQRSGAGFSMYLDRDAYFDSLVFATFNHGPTSQSNPTHFTRSLTFIPAKARCRTGHYGRTSRGSYCEGGFRLTPEDAQEHIGKQKPHSVLQELEDKSGALPFHLLGGRLRSGRSGGFGGHFRSDRIDLHRRENLFQAVEDFVAIDVLHQAFG